MATRLIAVRRVRVVLVAAAVLALVGGAGVVVAVVSGTSTARPPLWAQALAADSHLKGLGNPLFTRFRIQWSCPRVTAVSSGGTYVRVDFEHTGHCGVYGNTVALVLRRSHDAWVAEV